MWLRELKKGIIDLDDLQEQKWLGEQDLEPFRKVKKNFDIRVPHAFLQGDFAFSPTLSLQVIPSRQELLFLPEELEDPIGDEIHTPVKGLTHRYPDRVLLKPTYMCAMYCRFCFRRYKVSQSEFNLKKVEQEKAIQYIQDNKQIWEVILTGGDPLTLTDLALDHLLTSLTRIPHVQNIRFHTRIFSALPSRMEGTLLDILKTHSQRKSIWIAAHMNAAQEFCAETKEAIRSVVNLGIPVLLQSVLLKGINDTPEQLIDLFKTAVENRIKPYYLHYPDLARGTSHFRIPLSQAIQLVKGLRGKISGVCLPQFMIDIPGGKGKIVIPTDHIVQKGEHLWEMESPLDGSRTLVRYPWSE